MKRHTINILYKQKLSILNARCKCISVLHRCCLTRPTQKIILQYSFGETKERVANDFLWVEIFRKKKKEIMLVCVYLLLGRVKSFA